MTDLVITPASVVKGAGAKTVPGIASEAVIAGQTAYRDPTTKKFGKADSNAGSAPRSCVGIFLNGAAANQPVVVHTEGPLTIGATLVVGERYFVSDTAGGLIPSADLSAGEYVTMVGIAISASVLDVKIHNSGVAVPA